MRRSLRRTNRGNRRVFTITWVVLAALVLGMLGLRYRKASAAHAARHAGDPAQQAQPGASPDATPRVQPKPANERNG